MVFDMQWTQVFKRAAFKESKPFSDEFIWLRPLAVVITIQRCSFFFNLYLQAWRDFLVIYLNY